jgi:hypothetical protein
VVSPLPAVVGQSGRPVLRNRQVSPPKYGPITSNCEVVLGGLSGLAGQGAGVPSCGSEVLQFCHTSSSPNVSRVGTPSPSWRVGSGETKRLYQAWMPGQYWVAHAVPVSAEPVPGSLSSSAEFIRAQVPPKSSET